MQFFNTFVQYFVMSLSLQSYIILEVIFHGCMTFHLNQYTLTIPLFGGIYKILGGCLIFLPLEKVLGNRSYTCIFVRCLPCLPILTLQQAKVSQEGSRVEHKQPKEAQASEAREGDFLRKHHFHNSTPNPLSKFFTYWSCPKF